MSLLIGELKYFKDGRQNQVSQLESDGRKVDKMPSLARKRECRNDKLLECDICQDKLILDFDDSKG